MKLENKIRWQTKDKNGVTEIKSKRCAIRLPIGEKKKKKHSSNIWRGND